MFFGKLISWILGIMATGSVGGAAISFSGIKDTFKILNKFAKENESKFKGKKLELREDFSSISELKEKVQSIKDYLDDDSNSIDNKLENKRIQRVIKDLKGWINSKEENKKEYKEVSKKIDKLVGDLGKDFQKSSDKLKAEDIQRVLKKYSNSDKNVLSIFPFLTPFVNTVNEVDEELRKETHSFWDLNSPERAKWLEEYRAF